MGWTECDAQHYKNGKVDRKTECDNLWAKDCKVLKSTMKGSVYYGALQLPDGSVIGIVVITSGTNRRDPYFNFGYKAMDETVGPCCYDCPKGILDLLTPTDSEWANEWRNKCREKLATAKQKSWLNEIPVGGQVVWTNPKGEKVVLVKHAPAYQFRTWFWFDKKNYKYVSKKYVTEQNTAKWEPMYRETSTNKLMNFEEMKKYCQENYDYGDPTNYMTYVSGWWKEYGFEEVC